MAKTCFSGVKFQYYIGSKSLHFSRPTWGYIFHNIVYIHDIFIKSTSNNLSCQFVLKYVPLTAAALELLAAKFYVQYPNIFK
jgi:hypothetical protein